MMEAPGSAVRKFRAKLGRSRVDADGTDPVLAGVSDGGSDAAGAREAANLATALASLEQQLAGLRSEVGALRAELAASTLPTPSGSKGQAAISPVRSTPTAGERAGAARHNREMVRPGGEGADTQAAAPLGLPARPEHAVNRHIRRWRCRSGRLRRAAAPYARAIVRPRPAEMPVPAPLTWGELGALLAIMAVAAFLRFDGLAALPSGLHGDEGIAGLEGRRILRDGWIGVYTPSALGQPTGPFYVVAPAVWLFGDTILAVRLVPALLGTLTVLALYAVVRRNLGVRTALVAAALLAVMTWHVHFARIGFPLEAWPLVVVLAAGALAEATRSDGPRWWAAAGAAAGFGVYIYNAHPLVLAVFGLFALYHFYRWALIVPLGALALFAYAPSALTLAALAGGILSLMRDRRLASGHLARRAGAFALGAGVVLTPIARFAAVERNGYFNHARQYTILNKEPWTSLQGESSRVDFLLDRYLQFWDHLTHAALVDGVDASGVMPMVPLALLLLAVLGGGWGLLRCRLPLVSIGALMVLIMPFAAVTTIEGAARRTFAIAPFLALFGALGAIQLFRFAAGRAPMPRLGVVAGLALAVWLTVSQSVVNYRETFAKAPMQEWVFCRELTDAALYMRGLPSTSYVYFYSERWSVNYETRQFLAPDVRAEDRSAQFGRFAFDIDPANGTPVFVFLGAYRGDVETVRRLYPGGNLVEGGELGKPPTFVAYAPPVAP